jgi:Zn-finger protein
MSEPWGGPDDVCPKCGSADWMPADEGRFASCNDCGFVHYDEWTQEIMREVQREQSQCKQILGYLPTYQEAVKKGLAK